MVISMAMAMAMAAATGEPDTNNHQVCAFSGCQNPVLGGLIPATCDEVHHLQVMCARYCKRYPQFDPILRKFYSLDFRDGEADVCSLDGCRERRFPGHLWCSKTHYLDWLKVFYSKLNKPDQICTYPGCHYHVLVDDDIADGLPKVQQFCSWKHAQDAAMNGSYSQYPSANSPAASSDSQILIETPCLNIDTALELFQNFVRDRTHKPSNLRVDDEFFNKHPWQILKPGAKCCWIIVKCIWKPTSKKRPKVNAEVPKPTRKLETLEGYHWKPQGSPKCSGDGVDKRYLSYTVKESSRKGTKGIINHQSEISYKMIEYTVKNVEDYSVVYLYQGRDKCLPQRTKRQKLSEQHFHSSSSGEECS